MKVYIIQRMVTLLLKINLVGRLRIPLRVANGTYSTFYVREFYCSSVVCIYNYIHRFNIYKIHLGKMLRFRFLFNPGSNCLDQGPIISKNIPGETHKRSGMKVPFLHLFRAHRRVKNRSNSLQQGPASELTPINLSIFYTAQRITETPSFCAYQRYFPENTISLIHKLCLISCFIPTHYRNASIPIFDVL